MALVALGSFHGSPGATTTAVALAATWVRVGRSAVVAEVDPDGGVLAARLGLSASPSLVELCASMRAAADDLDIMSFAQQLPGGLPAIVAHPSPDRCTSALRSAGGRLGAWFSNLSGHDVIADVGRLRASSAAGAIIEHADVVLVVVRPELDEIAIARQAVAGLPGSARLVCIGDRPYSLAEVAANIGLESAGVMADDGRSAAILRGHSGSGRTLRRLPLMRSAAVLSRVLADVLDEPARVELAS